MHTDLGIHDIYAEDDDYGGSNSTSFDDDETVEKDVDTVLSVIWFNCFFLILIMLLHNFLKWNIPSIYMGRNNHVSEVRQMDPIPMSWFPLSWLRQVIKVSWREVRIVAGLDAYMLLRFLHMCGSITAVSSFWGIVILWPIYYNGGKNDKEGWYIFSLANVSKGSDLLWAPTVFMWLFTFYTIRTMDRELRHYVDLRMEFLGRGDRDIAKQYHYSLMVEKIPVPLRGDKALFDYFNALFPGKVHSANAVRKVPELQSRISRRKETMKRLEKALAFYASTGRRPTHQAGRGRCRCCGIECAPYTIKDSEPIIDDEYDDQVDFVSEARSRKGERVDSIRYYRQLLDDINDEVSELQRDAVVLAEVGNYQLSAENWISRILRLDVFSYEMAQTSYSRASTWRSLSGHAPFPEEESTLDGGKLSLAEDTDVTSLTLAEPLVEHRVHHDVVDHARPGLELKGKNIFEQAFRVLGGTFLLTSLSSFRRNIDVVMDTVTGASTSSTGFVTFNDLCTVTAAASAPLTVEPNVLIVAIAPEPRDLIFENIVVDLDTVEAKKKSASLLVAFGALLWSVPVAAIQIWCTSDSLSEVRGFHWMANSENESVANFINGWLPVVTIMGLMQVLPIIFQELGIHYEGRKTSSNVEESILKRYFIYQLANVYVTVTSYSIFDSLNEIIEEPTDTALILGRSLPTVVGYFVSLVATKTLIGVPSSMMRWGALLRYGLLRALFCSKSRLTQRELDTVYREQKLKYGREYPSFLLVVIICQCYATIAPIILPFGALFFWFAALVFKMQVLHVFTPVYESGGVLFIIACNRVLVGLIFGQLTLIGYLSLRDGYLQSTALVPLLFITYFSLRYNVQEYETPSTNLTMERAQEIDKYETAAAVREFDEYAYRQPILTEPLAVPLPYRREQHQAVISTIAKEENQPNTVML